MSIWKNKVMLGSLGLNFMCRYSVILNWINILVLEHADGNLYINVLNENNTTITKCVKILLA